MEPSPSPNPAPAGLLTLRGWTRGERMIVMAGVPLVVVLWRLPWHRFGLSVADDFRRLGLGEIPIFRPIETTALETPNGLLGRGALVLAALMVALVVGGRLLASRRAVPAAWQQLHLVAGAAALGLLVAKLAARNEFVTGTAWLAVGLAGLLAYAGYARSQEAAGPDPAQASPSPPGKA